MYMHKFFIKRVKRTDPRMVSIIQPTDSANTQEKHEESPRQKGKTNSKKKKDNMDTKDKIKQVIDTFDDYDTDVRVLKKDKSLIERTRSSKIVLTEDNKELLND